MRHSSPRLRNSLRIVLGAPLEQSSALRRKPHSGLGKRWNFGSEIIPRRQLRESGRR